MFALSVIIIIYMHLSSNVDSIPMATKSTQDPAESWNMFTIFIVIAACLAALIIIIIVYNCYKKWIERSKSKGYQGLEGDDGSKRQSYHDDNNYGPSGLKNTHETCYLNSMFQGLASSNQIINKYEELQSICYKHRPCEKLNTFIKLLKDINSPDRSRNYVKDNTNDMLALMKDVNWETRSQQDSFQLLSAVINSIQHDIKDILLKEEMTMPLKIKMLHSFTQTPQYNKVQDHLALAVPLCGDFQKRPGVPLSKLIDAFFSPSKIDDSSNETKISFFEEAPDVMLIHIQANEWDANLLTFVKPKYYIRYEETLMYTFKIQMEIDGSRDVEKKVNYMLTAVVHHMGGTDGGHYVTYRKFRNDWFLTNDEQVERVDFNCDVVPYIMVYEKI